MKPPGYHSTNVLRGLRETLNRGPIIPRDAISKLFFPGLVLTGVAVAIPNWRRLLAVAMTTHGAKRWVLEQQKKSIIKIIQFIEFTKKHDPNEKPSAKQKLAHSALPYLAIRHAQTVGVNDPSYLEYTEQSTSVTEIMA